MIPNQADEPLVPPTVLETLRDGLGILELARLVAATRHLSSLPRGDGAAVMLLPGFGTGDASNALLRGYLRHLGYDARGWGLGRNSGEVPSLIPRVADRVAAWSDAIGAPVHLVGWSLGGYLGREAARERPDVVAQVIMFGSPVVGGPKYTAAARYYLRQGVDVDAIEVAAAEREAVALQVPVTAIYSRADGVVAWRACIDRINAVVQHVEVAATHVGLGFSPEVWEIVVRRLYDRSRELAAAVD